MLFIQDSWRNLTNAFDNEKKLFLLDSAHQVRGFVSSLPIRHLNT